MCRNWRPTASTGSLQLAPDPHDGSRQAQVIRDGLLQRDEGETVAIEQLFVGVHVAVARQHGLRQHRVALHERLDRAGDLLDDERAHLERVHAQARHRLVDGARRVRL